MVLFNKLALTALIGASALTAMPVEAEARERHHRESRYSHGDNDRWNRDYRRDDRGGHYRDRRYSGNYHCRRGSGTTGMIIGGAAGALLGREVDRYGDRTPGTIIGAAGGALIGREIGRGGRC
ncbi:MAG: glycine zipper 2TM domain-containing protein [Sphingopyxis sp.]|nr:glycine zipper 2TM domain-containing protein [Sphingopyxis sp.]